MSPRRTTQESKTPVVMDNGIVIPVMGPTGAGKSTFINVILDEEKLETNRMGVGYTLSSCTKDIQIARINPPTGIETSRPIYLVDTPGFDDTYEGDAEILRRISSWLKNHYKNRGIVLGGVIYLHDISQDRFSGTARRNLELFNHMCGDSALVRVVLGTTKWIKIGNEIGKRYEQELRTIHWKWMLERGATVSEHHVGYGSARALVDQILNKIDWKDHTGTVLEIQTELAVNKKLLPQTKAGKELRYTLQQVLDIQKEMLGYEQAAAKSGDQHALDKLEEANKKKQALEKQVKELHLSFRQRFTRIFRSMQ